MFLAFSVDLKFLFLGSFYDQVFADLDFRLFRYKTLLISSCRINKIFFIYPS